MMRCAMPSRSSRICISSPPMSSAGASFRWAKPRNASSSSGRLASTILSACDLPDRAAVARHVGISLDRPLFLITYHPATLDDADPASGVEELLAALAHFPEAALVFTKANADSGGRAINRRLESFAMAHAGRAVLVSSLGQQLYLAALKQAAVVIGNSSSGIIEAPAAGTPTVNVGIRQKGRPRAASIVDCDEQRDAIAAAIRRARDPAMRSAMARGDPPYGRPRNAAASMLQELRTTDLKAIMRKRFHDLAPARHATGRDERGDECA